MGPFVSAVPVVPVMPIPPMVLAKIDKALAMVDMPTDPDAISFAGGAR